MEAKFFSEIEKKMDVKTLKDFEKEVRTTINNEFEFLRKKNDLSRVLTAGECEMWSKIRNEDYSWLQIKSDKKRNFIVLLIFTRNLLTYLIVLKILIRKLRELNH